MKINFDEMEFEVVNNFNGGNKYFKQKKINDGFNKILIGRLEKGCSIGMHKHDGTSEIIHVISGSGIMTTDEGEEILSSGDVHYCPANSSHSFRNDNDEDLIFLAVVPNHKVA